MSEHELRFSLRQLPRDKTPGRDLWPGIEARLQPRSADARPGWGRGLFTGLAIAASLCLAIGLAWRLGPSAANPPDPQAELVQREADTLVREYERALGELAAIPLPGALLPALATLDESAIEIRSALDRDPGAVYLLDQLRRTYARRLSLTQRAATG